jgi:hypothetical protein
VPDTDDADIYLLPVARCYHKILADKGKQVSVEMLLDRLGLWCDTWAPHLTPDQVADVVDRVLDGPSIFENDDELGKRLRVSYADRRRLKLRTIGAYDVNRKSRKKLQRAEKRRRDRLDAEKRRRANGAMPRAQYEANSLSKTKPWERMGISRAKYYRLPPEQRIETSASPHPSISMSDGLVSRSQSNCQRSLTPDGIGATKPSAIAFGTPKESTPVMGVEGAALVGNPEADRQRKTRFPSAMRLNKQMMAEALARGFERQRIGNLFEHFKQWNIAMRTYSADWGEVWSNWLDRQVDTETEEYHRQCTRAWLERRAAA